MKRVSAAVLCLMLLLCGCGGGEKEELLALQQRWSQWEKVNAEVEITCHLAGSSRSFTVQTVCEAQGATSTITEPEELAGLSVTVTGEELLLSYEGAALSAGIPQVLSPAVCVPYLLRAVTQGYVLEYGSETLDGMDCLRATFEVTAPDDTAIICTAWFERASGAPCYSEFSVDGTVILTARTLNFEMKEKEGAAWNPR